uniref:CLIP domain-containing serine protease n=1 Tax=Anopheles farauti TaxID=69004 RepID=A0A182QQA1_9DIPT
MRTARRGCVRTVALVITIVIVVMCALPTSDAQYQSQCRTPNQQAGVCVSVTQCPLVMRLINQPLLTRNDVLFLEQSRCGVMDRKVLVCCAAPETTSASPVATAPRPTTQSRPPPVNVPPRVPQTTPSNAPPNAASINNRLSNSERLALLPGECGIQYTDRIIGGERARLDEYPWTVLIQHRRRTGELKFHCGGAIITERYVLTAAHCIKNVPSTWTLTAVRLGEWDTQSEQDCAQEYGETVCADPVQDIPIEKILLHPNYHAERSGVKNDIAQLRLARPAQFNDFVQPICLPLEPSERRASYDGVRFVVAGWGQTEEAANSRYKLFVGVSGVPEQTCRQAYPQSNIDGTQVCAGGTKDKDSCRGDSGGPLMYIGQRNGESVMYLGGVVSYGRKCGLEGVPGVYTRVNQFIDWIVGNLEP